MQSLKVGTVEVIVSSVDSLAIGHANAHLVEVIAVRVAGTLVAIATIVEAIGMVEVIVMVAVEVVAVMAVVVEVIVTVTAPGDLTVRMGDLITGRVVQNTVVTGTATGAVTVMQVVTDMQVVVVVEVLHVTRVVLEIVQDPMTGLVVDPEATMIVIEERLLC